MKKILHNEDKKIKEVEENQVQTETEIFSEKQEKETESKESLELKNKLDEVQKELIMYKERSLRAIAELSNYRKKFEQDTETFRKYTNSELIFKILPIVDSFENALKRNDIVDKNAIKFFDGIKLIYKELISVLEKEGLKRQDVRGKVFDPMFHEVVLQVETDEVEEGTILEELRYGYNFKDKVLRPAMVKVAKNPVSEKIVKQEPIPNESIIDESNSDIKS
ncbi:MAG: nucleotide exchange factor GrpE [Candidatus Firestonebacteria bacterium]